MELSVTEFAKEAGVKHTSILEGIKSGKLIRNSNKMLDTENILNKKYLDKKKSKRKDDFLIKQINAAKEFSAQNAIAINDNDADFIEQALYVTPILINETRKITNNSKFQNAKDFSEIVKYLKDLTTIYDKQENINERNGRFIETDFVSTICVGYMEIIKNRIEDWPASNIDTLIATGFSTANIQATKEQIAAASGAMLDFMRKEFSKILENAVEQTTNKINNYKPNTKADNSEANKVKEIEEKIEQLQEAQNEN